MQPQHKFKYEFTLEGVNKFEISRKCIAYFHAYPARRGTYTEPPEPASVEWLNVLLSATNFVYTVSFSPDEFEPWAREFESNPNWSLSQFDNEALQIADDYIEAKQEEAWEAKSDQARMDKLEATTRGDN